VEKNTLYTNRKSVGNSGIYTEALGESNYSVQCVRETNQFRNFKVVVQKTHILLWEIVVITLPIVEFGGEVPANKTIGRAAVVPNMVTQRLTSSRYTSPFAKGL